MLNFGINPDICDWFKSFLANRISKVKIGNIVSENHFANISGVLQGTVTGPFLFLVYIDDLLSAFPDDVKVTAFADDLKLYSTNRDSLQKSLGILSEWCVKWKLALAENKTLVLHLGKSNPKHSYFTGTTKVQSTTCARDLGILVDDALTFENHIDKIVNNALHKSRMVLRSFRSSNPNFYFKLFNVFIRPTLEYGCELFHPSSSRLTARLDYPLRFFF
uniref:Reverse transcriptase domain-containing protein n=1 Tax=Caenorhabditis japonica TaxID=281687 RepID=A0A8R1E7W9_CAEJA